ncbi:UNVERIFIED_CONTAM: Oxysterol-binding protein-related protein 1D [Sesamum radiatum]|uniref:Oxysterol-binding protein-related protein 1D n=1 Tax=Sesamum radiatum TaxID=300843 RepID=A0AAW2TUH3_SESRA
MNPLCCIAPVSVEKDRAVVKPQTLSQELVFDKDCGNVAESNDKNVIIRPGWRERWFVLEDGVLSYYKVHGPDKIVFSGREKGVRVIGEDSWKYMRKGSTGNGSRNGSRGNGFGLGKQWKPFGEIHLKEGISEIVVKDCESIMLGEVALMQNHLKTLQLKHILLLDTLRRLEVHGFVQDNRTGEKVAVLLGKWDEAIDKSIAKTRYNLTPFAISLNELTPELQKKLPPTDSRLRPDQRHLENGEYELANAEKLRLEQLQRQARKLQDRGWKPRWFQKDEDGCYRYMGGYWEAREKQKWDEIPDIFRQPCDFPVCAAEE